MNGPIKKLEEQITMRKTFTANNKRISITPHMRREIRSLEKTGSYVICVNLAPRYDGYRFRPVAVHHSIYGAIRELMKLRSLASRGYHIYAVNSEGSRFPSTL